MLFDPNAAGSTSSTNNRSLEFIAVILAGETSASTSSGAAYLEAGGDEEEAPEAGSSKANGSNGLLPPILQQIEGKPRIDGILKWIEDAGVSGESGHENECQR